MTFKIEGAAWDSASQIGIPRPVRFAHLVPAARPVGRESPAARRHWGIREVVACGSACAVGYEKRVCPCGQTPSRLESEDPAEEKPPEGQLHLDTNFRTIRLAGFER